MANDKKYLEIMIDSLNKKEKILDTIILKNEAQKECVSAREYGDIEWERFDVLLEEKETLIERLNELDDGFEALYERVRDELNENKSQYSAEIKTMQELIKRITDKGVTIQTTEERNRQLIERVMTSAKKDIKHSRKSLKAASDYYKSMSVMSRSSDPTQVDKKK